MVAPLGSLSKAISWDCLVLDDSGNAGAGLVNGAVSLISVGFGFDFFAIAFFETVFLGVDLMISFFVVAVRMFTPSVVAPPLG